MVHTDPITELARDVTRVTKYTIQWLPAHINIQGSDEVDQLAKQGGSLQQNHVSTTDKTANTFIGVIDTGESKQGRRRRN